MGIDPSTVRLMPENPVFDQTFVNDPSNSEYLLGDAVDNLPDQKLNIEIQNTRNEYTNFLVAVKRSKEYNINPVTIYFAPLYTCTDPSDGIQYIYGDFNYVMNSPKIVSDKYAEKLLKELGQ
jgi:hypothetical protein